MTPGAGGRGSTGPPGAPEPQVASLLNGDEMKQSPASTHGGLNGGTPGTAGGPGAFLTSRSCLDYEFSLFIKMLDVSSKSVAHFCMQL